MITRVGARARVCECMRVCAWCVRVYVEHVYVKGWCYVPGKHVQFTPNILRPVDERGTSRVFECFVVSVLKFGGGAIELSACLPCCPYI